MTIWDLRQLIETHIPVWAPFAFIGVLGLAYLMDLGMGGAIVYGIKRLFRRGR